MSIVGAPSSRPRLWLWLCTLAGLLAWVPAGCEERFDELELDLDRVQHYSSRPLSDTLGACVVAGFVNYSLIDRKYEHALDHFLRWAGKEGPTTRPEAFPFTSHHSAYYINVYHGLVLRCWLDHGAREQDPTRLSLDPAWHEEKTYLVDGQLRSINEVKRLALDTGDPRLMMVLADGTRFGPIFHNAAFPAGLESFEDEMHRRLVTQFSTPGLFTVSDGGVSAPHWLADTAQPGQSPSLESLLDRYLSETHSHKPVITRAARDGTLTFRPRDLLINHPANR